MDNKNIFDSIAKVIFNSFFAIIIVIFIIIYIIDVEVLSGGKAFSDFFTFGPDYTGKTKFLGMKLDSWSKVSTLYTLSFFMELFNSYFFNISFITTNQVYNAAITEIPASRTEVMSLLYFGPILSKIISTINSLLMISTMQLQYILPGFLAMYIVDRYMDIQLIKGKTFNPEKK